MSTRQPKCGICKQERRGEIDAALSVDHVIAQVARRFEVAESPLRRHRDQGHHLPDAPASVDPEQPPAATSSHQQPPAAADVPQSGGGDGEPDQGEELPPEEDEEEQEAEPSTPPAAWSAPQLRPAPANPARSYLQANTLDAALGRAQMSIKTIRKTEPVVAADGRKYKTARTTDIVRAGRAALLAEGLVLTQVSQTVKIVGRTPVLTILYLLRYVRTNPAQTEYFDIDMPLPSDKSQDVHFRTSSASTYALRLFYKRALQIEEQEDDKDVMLPSIPASEPDPWGLIPEAPISEATIAEREERLRNIHDGPDLPPGTDALVKKHQKEARGREFAQRSIRKKEAAAASSRGHEDISE